MWSFVPLVGPGRRFPFDGVRLPNKWKALVIEGLGDLDVLLAEADDNYELYVAGFEGYKPSKEHPHERERRNKTEKELKKVPACAWVLAAGCLDGGGYIKPLVKRNGEWAQSIQVTESQGGIALLHVLYFYLGGSVYWKSTPEDDDDDDPGSFQPGYVWVCQGPESRMVLGRAIPFMRLKMPQASAYLSCPDVDTSK